MNWLNPRLELFPYDDKDPLLSWVSDELEKQCLQSLYENSDETGSTSGQWTIPDMDSFSSSGVNDLDSFGNHSYLEGDDLRNEDNMVPIGSGENSLCGSLEEMMVSPLPQDKNDCVNTSTALDGLLPQEVTPENRVCASSSLSYVDHSYVDFSKVDDRKVTSASCILGEKLFAIMEFGGATCKEHVGIIGGDSQSVAKAKNRTRNKFPKKLMTLLDDNPSSDIISWLPHGRGFIVKDSKRFISDIHPKYFTNSIQYKTFIRMLNMWDFKRITKGPDCGAYYHQMFLKGMPNLVVKMQHMRRKNGGKRLIANPKDEPNFYALSKTRPLKSCRMN